jgi:hypothetical protein
MKLSLLTMAFLATGCGPGFLGGRSHATPYAMSENALSFNGLVDNGLLTNGLRMNGLRMNGLRMNGLTVDSFTINDRPQDESLWILGYIVSCALPADRTLTVTVDGTSYDLAGGLGLAPSFEFDALSDPTDQEWVTACLMARTNWKSSFEAPHTVAISLRGNHPNLIQPDPGFIYLDSGFFGNLFTEPASLYSCDTNDGIDLFAVADRGRLAGELLDHPGYFPGFSWGSALPSIHPIQWQCWGHSGLDLASPGATGACNAVYDGRATIPDGDAFDQSEGLTYDQAILSSCNGGGATWTHPIFATLDSLTDPS